jgi:hypothetical protein
MQVPVNLALARYTMAKLSRIEIDVGSAMMKKRETASQLNIKYVR